MTVTAIDIQPRVNGLAHLRIEENGEWRDASKEEATEWVQCLADGRPMTEFYAKLSERAGL